VLEYGFGFYLAALNEHQYIMNINRKNMAIAVRVATKADGKNWKKFIRRK